MNRIKIGTKTLSLVRGKAARVYYSEKTPVPGKPFRFWRISNFREKSTWHSEQELEAVQKQARQINAAAEKVGIDFAAPTNEEREAIIEWRTFKAKTQTGSADSSMFYRKRYREKPLAISRRRFPMSQARSFNQKRNEEFRHTTNKRSRRAFAFSAKNSKTPGCRKSCPSG